MSMSDMAAREDEATTAWANSQRIKLLRQQIERSFLELAQRLWEFRDRREYTYLGYDTFEEYIADPDIDISRSVAYRLLGIHETFVLMPDVPPVGLLEAGTTKLDMVRPHVTPENAQEWVDKATALSKSDLQLEIDALKPERPKPAGVLFKERGIGHKVLKRAYEAMPDWSRDPVEITIRQIGDRKDGNE